MQTQNTKTVVQATGLTKLYGEKLALNNVSLDIKAGQIVGLIGPNGAGKTTALRCLMGLSDHAGNLTVMGKRPFQDRIELLREVAYIADTAILPKWITASQLIEYTAATHPKFDRKQAFDFLAQTEVGLTQKVGTLSKGMITQLHLALAISIDAKLLILDEPTLGLDILYRKKFFEQLLNDYFDEDRTIIISTHQVEEVEQILTDLVFIQRGSINLQLSMDQVESQFYELEVSANEVEAARSFAPIHEIAGLGNSRFIYHGANPSELQKLGRVKTPSIADLFVAKMA